MTRPGGPAVPVLSGPTACGKTEALLRLADRIGMEVVSADSRQVYRGMDIGTAKPAPEDRARLPHHLLDILDPDEGYSAWRFSMDAAGAVGEIRSRGALPVVAGGTALYLMAFAGMLDALPGTCRSLRNALVEIESDSPGELRRFLDRLDPASADRIRTGDTVRTLRALEIILLSGRTATSSRKGGSGPAGIVGIRMVVPQTTLRARISARTAGMLERGLVEEVEDLAARGYGRDSALGRTIGYVEVLDMLEGLCTPEELRQRIEADTWRFARRQLNMLSRIPWDHEWDGTDESSLARWISQPGG
ncbi:tRNA (adenosine(37)-N6)-dimethylallyltransferase MiaA [Candidatus Fermentibacteria bacterium]|nr:tRNA (adenosine(37)-N6)-dimethylallyltransferase MiaA [Candidatus Fermentibacteria bacterium]